MEPKWDGFQFQIIKDGAGVRLYSKSGAEYTDQVAGDGRGLRLHANGIGDPRW